MWQTRPPSVSTKLLRNMNQPITIVSLENYEDSILLHHNNIFVVIAIMVFINFGTLLIPRMNFDHESYDLRVGLCLLSLICFVPKHNTTHFCFHNSGLNSSQRDSWQTILQCPISANIALVHIVSLWITNLH